VYSVKRSIFVAKSGSRVRVSIALVNPFTPVAFQPLPSLKTSPKLISHPPMKIAFPEGAGALRS
jgi:hypothetical protein